MSENGSEMTGINFEDLSLSQHNKIEQSDKSDSEQTIKDEQDKSKESNRTKKTKKVRVTKTRIVKQKKIVELDEDEQNRFEDVSEQIREERRDTFVGTPLYVSPEMLLETRSCPGSDLWALGCIIF